MDYRRRNSHRADRIRHRPVTRADLLAAAVASDARPQAIQLLQRLPDRAYTNIRELWHHLPGVPVNE